MIRLFIAAFMSHTAYALPPVASVQCQVPFEKDAQPSRMDTAFDIGNLESCQVRSEKFPIQGTDLTLEVSYAAACQRSHSSSYGESIAINLAGPIGSDVYASSTSFPVKGTLQLIAKVNNVKYNVIAHCQIAR